MLLPINWKIIESSICGSSKIIEVVFLPIRQNTKTLVDYYPSRLNTDEIKRFIYKKVKFGILLGHYHKQLFNAKNMDKG